MVELQRGDVVVYEGSDSEELIGYVGIITTLEFPHRNDKRAWQVEWLFPIPSDKHWVWEYNLRKLGEVPHG